MERGHQIMYSFKVLERSSSPHMIQKHMQVIYLSPSAGHAYTILPIYVLCFLRNRSLSILSHR
jgi:hypothetical protein